jgi:hypothetical protein
MNSDETVRMTLPGKAGKSAGRIPITNQFAGIFRKLLFRMSKWKRPFACWQSGKRRLGQRSVLFRHMVNRKLMQKVHRLTDN